MCKCKKSGICQNRELCKIGNFSKSGGIEWGNRSLQLRCQKELPPTSYILLYNCANEKKREVDKIGNFAKSGVLQNREFRKIGRRPFAFSTITVAMLKRIASNMLYTAV